MGAGDVLGDVDDGVGVVGLQRFTPAPGVGAGESPVVREVFDEHHPGNASPGRTSDEEGESQNRDVLPRVSHRLLHSSLVGGGPPRSGDLTSGQRGRAVTQADKIVPHEWIDAEKNRDAELPAGATPRMQADPMATAARSG